MAKQRKSEYTNDLINKQTHLNYEIFGQKKKLITNNNKILIFKVFKAWEHVRLEGNNGNDTFLKDIITKRKQHLEKINSNYNILKEMKIQLSSKRGVKRKRHHAINTKN